MRFSLNTLLKFRQATLMMLAAIEDMLLEGYGWTPRAHSRQSFDNRDTIDA